MNATIEEAKRIAFSTDKAMDGIKTKSDDRSTIATRCLDMVFEHRWSVIVLIENRLYGSAATLLRPIFESYLRGAWFYLIASDREIDDFQNKDILRKNNKELIDELEKLEDFEDKFLSIIKNRYSKLLNSYTHTGFNHVGRRIKDGEISANYDDKDISDYLFFATSVSILASVKVAQIACNKSLEEKLGDIGMSFFEGLNID